MAQQRECPHCRKPAPICVCADIRPLATRHEVLILQHPREPGEVVGSAETARLALERAHLRTGLSWPNLASALEQPRAEPSRYAVLFLGSANAFRAVQEAARNRASDTATGDRLVLLDRRGRPLAPERAAERRRRLHGLVVLDGSWRQAKALWWRNPWLLKLQRAVLIPARPSLYGRVRREPRRECLSTLEAIAIALDCLGETSTVREQLLHLFQTQVERMAAHRLGPRRRMRRSAKRYGRSTLRGGKKTRRRRT